MSKEKKIVIEIMILDTIIAISVFYILRTRISHFMKHPVQIMDLILFIIFFISVLWKSGTTYLLIFAVSSSIINKCSGVHCTCRYVACSLSEGKGYL